MAMIKSIFFLLLFSATAFAQATAVIDGPKEGMAGDLVVLNSVNSKGDVSKWIVPDTLGNRYIKVGHQLAFAVRDSGEFTFQLVVVDVTSAEEPDVEPTIDIAIASHTYKNVDGICEPPSDPDQPDDPADPDDPPGDMAELIKASRDGAKAVDDPVTAKRLIDAIKPLIGSNQDVEQLRELVRSAVEAAFALREGESEDKDWLTKWRKPVNELVDSSTLTQYNASLKAIVTGLQQSLGESPGRDPPDVPPDKRDYVIRMMTRDNCGWCARWKREVQPGVEQLGFKVIYEYSRASVPAFVVSVNGNESTFTGYQYASAFKKLISNEHRLVD